MYCLIITATSVEVVDAEDVTAPSRSPLTKAGANNARATSDQDAIERITALFITSPWLGNRFQRCALSESISLRVTMTWPYQKHAYFHFLIMEGWDSRKDCQKC